MPGVPVRALALACLLTAALPSPAAAWGATGHAVVAEIAQRRLTPAARRAVEDLLGGASLASIANWADSVQLIRPDTRPWHYVNIPLEAEAYDAARDCPKGTCIVAALERQRAILCDRTTDRTARAEALRFVVHLVADVHQPLHTAERDGDLGGVHLPVTLLGEPTNLHAVWDYGLLNQGGFDWGEHVRRIEVGDLSDVAAEPLDGPIFARWANEAHHLAARAAYAGLKEGSIRSDYIKTRSEVIDRQLGHAGVRLGRILNKCMH